MQGTMNIKLTTQN